MSGKPGQAQSGIGICAADDIARRGDNWVTDARLNIRAQVERLSYVCRVDPWVLKKKSNMERRYITFISFGSYVAAESTLVMGENPEPNGSTGVLLVTISRFTEELDTA